MFGIPFVVAETGAAFCVFIAATGHLLAGSIGYVAVKIFGFGLVVPIFDLTREKLMRLPWFAYLYEKLLAFHHFALATGRALSRRGDRRLAVDLLRPRPRAVGRAAARGRTKRRADGARGAGRRFCPIGFG